MKYIKVLNQGFTQDECKSLLDTSNQQTYEFAPITIDGSKGIFESRPDIRNNDRVILDDVWLADTIFNRLKKDLPQEFDGWSLLRLNERFRFYRYGSGQQFKKHCDGAYVVSETEESKLTLLIYLTDDFEGGSTKFFFRHKDDIEVIPVVGDILVFDHTLLHSGEPVLEGFKYVLRTDVIYKKL